MQRMKCTQTVAEKLIKEVVAACRIVFLTPSWPTSHWYPNFIHEHVHSKVFEFVPELVVCRKSICSIKYVNFRSILSGSFVYNCVKWTFTLYHLMRTLTAVLICSNLSLIVVWKFLPLWFRDHKLYVYCSDPWFKLSFRIWEMFFHLFFHWFKAFYSQNLSP